MTSTNFIDKPNRFCMSKVSSNNTRNFDPVKHDEVRANFK